MVALGLWCLLGLVFGMNLFIALLQVDESILRRQKWKLLAFVFVSGPIFWLIFLGVGLMALAHYIAEKIKEEGNNLC